MDVLLSVQRQLSCVLDDVSLHSEDSSSSSPTDMTPVLIRIEQLLDEIRVCTRSIVASSSLKRRTEKKCSKPMERDDFRLKLETKDVIDYNSETETEDEGKEEEEEPVDTVGVKRPREAEEGGIQEEPELKRPVVRHAPLDPELYKTIKRYLHTTKKLSMLKETEHGPIVKKGMRNVAEWTTKSMKRMLEFIRNGGVPMDDVAIEFRDATILLPSIIARCRTDSKISNKWISSTTYNIAQISAFARENGNLPNCLSDPQLEETQHAITKGWKDWSPEFLRKMELFIERMSKPDALDPECMEKPLGRLASLFCNDFKACKPAKKSSRTEEDWTRFSKIGEVLADWIQQSQRASTPPKLRPHLLRFDRQLKGFAKNNPDRVPASLLEFSAVLVGFGKEPNINKKA